MVKRFNPEFRIGQGGILEVSADKILPSDAFFVLVDASAGPITVTLQRADGFGGKRYCIMKVDNSVNAVTIVPIAGQTINGVASVAIAGQFGVVELISDNEEYEILNQTVGSPQFINLKLAGSQGGINVNTEVAFVLESASGLSVVANRVTLKAGVTYVLFATMRHLGSVSNTAASYVWRDHTNAVNLGISDQVTSMDGLSKDGDSPPIMVVIKPTTDIDVGVINTGVSAPNQGLVGDATQASIHSI